MLAAYAGLRCGEIARLQASDLRFDRTPPTILVRGKGGRQREVPAAPIVVDALTGHGVPARGRVFRRQDGQPAGPRHVAQAGNRWLHRRGLTATMHQLRHRFASQVYQATRDLRMVQELLGHASVATTQVHTAVDDAAAVAAVLALAAAGSQGPLRRRSRSRSGPLRASPHPTPGTERGAMGTRWRAVAVQ